MAPPPSDPSYQTKKKGAPIKFLVPLIYAPALPLIRLALRHKPVLRDRLFTGVLAGAFAHGMYLVLLYLARDMYRKISAFESEACTSKEGVVTACYMIRTDIYDAESK